MKKRMKILALTILMVFVSTMLLGVISLADNEDIVSDITGKMKTAAEEEAGSDAERKIMDVGATIVYAVKYVGLVLSIILVIWFGIKWMTANPQQKAQLQDQAWNYVIGAALLFGSGHIAQWIYDMVTTGIGV